MGLVEMAARLVLALAAALVAAHAVGRSAARLGQPRVVGEMLAGVLVGPSVLGGGALLLFPLEVRTPLGLIGELGVLLFSFLVGLELDRRVLKAGRRLALVTIGSIGGPILVGLALSSLMYTRAFVPGFGTAGAPGRVAFGFGMAGLLAVSALPVLARILQEEEQRSGPSPVGPLAIAAGAATTILMFHLLQMATTLGAGGSVAAVLERAGLSAIYLVVMWSMVRPGLLRLSRLLDRRGMVAPVLLVCAASSLVTRELGLSVVVGAFVAGVVSPRGDEAVAALAARLHTPVVVVLLPIFLTVSGLQTDLRLLDRQVFVGVVLLLTAAVAAKVAPVALGARVARIPGAAALQLGVLLNCRGLLVLVASIVLLQQGLVTPAVHVASVVVALVTTIGTAPTYRALARRVTRTVSVPGPALPLEGVAS